MICPHCNANLLYKERPGHRCSRCSKHFALDPKLNLFRLHDIRFRKITAKLSSEGSFFYTPSQLWYQAARKLVAQQKQGLSCVTFTIVVAMIGTGIAIFTNLDDLSEAVTCILPIIIGALVFLPIAWLLNIYFRKPWRYLKIPLSLDQFSEKVIKRWRAVYGDHPMGLVDARSKRSDQPPPEQLWGIVLCPEQDILTCLRANRVHEQLGLGLIPTGGELTQAEKTVVGELGSRPNLPVFLLHDASPSGALLGQNIEQKSHRKVIDLGIHPRQAIEHNLMKLGKQPSPEDIKRLEKLVKVGKLSQQEFDWLKEGYISPILGLTPNRLIKILTNAVRRGATSMPPETVTPEEQAKAVGFLTWPTAS